MKTKYILLICAIFAIWSCKDEVTDSSAVVTMQKQAMAVKESQGLFTVPIHVEGKHNGITLSVATVEETDFPAEENKHYIITSKEINIPEGVTTGYVEIKAIDDDDINAARVFTLTISSIKGALRGSQSSTVISLIDNDSNIYEKLGGKWTLECTNADDEEEVLKFPFIISTASPNSSAYNHEVSAVWNWEANEQIMIPLALDMPVSINPKTKLGYISFICDGNTVIGSYKGGFTWTLIMLKEGASRPTKGYLNGEWTDPKCKEIVFDNEYQLCVYQPSKGIWLKATNLKLIRK